MGDAGALLAGAANVVILWGERIGRGERATATLDALADLALLAGDGEGSGLIEVPAVTNARGCGRSAPWPGWGLGSRTRSSPASRRARSRRKAACRPCTCSRRTRCASSRTAPGGRALGAAAIVIVHSQFLTRPIERHADVVFPAESYAEKEGTVTHPDGRVERLRPAIGRPGRVRAGMAGAERGRPGVSGWSFRI